MAYIDIVVETAPTVIDYSPPSAAEVEYVAGFDGQFSSLAGDPTDNASLVTYVDERIRTIKRIVHLDTDFSTTSATYVDVTGLSVSLEAGKEYLIEGYFLLSTPTNGSRLTAVWPNGTGRMTFRTNLTDQIQRAFTQATISGAGSQETQTMDAGAFGGFCVINGGLNCLTSGTFKVQVRSITGGNTSIVRNHSSYLKITELT